MAEVLVIGKKISEMGLVNEITGEEKIPTSALGDKAVTTSQLLTYVNNNGVAQWGRIGGDITNQGDLQNQFTQERDTLKSYTQGLVSQQQVALQEHIDTTNEVFNYARDNGSALPYKEGVSYEEGAVVVKDGMLQQWKGGSWKSAVADILSDTIQTFNTPEAGVDPVTGVADGAYFNVRSSSNESYVDEYQNVGGVATPTGKSSSSGAAVQEIADYTALPFVDGKTYSLNERVQLENGVIVKNIIVGNKTDPNSDMTGWALTGNTLTFETALELPEGASEGDVAFVKDTATIYIKTENGWTLQSKRTANISDVPKYAHEVDDSGRFLRLAEYVNNSLAEESVTGGYRTATAFGVIISSGIYTISQEIKFNGFVSIVSDAQALIKQTATLRTFVFDMTENPTYQPIISGIRFVWGTTALYFSNGNLDTTRISVQDCAFYGQSVVSIDTFGTIRADDPHMSCIIDINRCFFLAPKKAFRNVCDKATIRNSWLYPTRYNFDADSAFIVNQEGVLTLDNCLGVPVMGMGTDHVQYSRWVDNYGSVIVDKCRFGLEDAGLPFIYSFGGEWTAPDGRMTSYGYPSPATSGEGQGSYIIIKNSHICSGLSYALPDAGVVVLRQYLPQKIVIEDNNFILESPYIAVHPEYTDFHVYLDVLINQNAEKLMSKYKYRIDSNMELQNNTQLYPLKLGMLINHGAGIEKDLPLVPFIKTLSSSSSSYFTYMIPKWVHNFTFLVTISGNFNPNGSGEYRVDSTYILKMQTGYSSSTGSVVRFLAATNIGDTTVPVEVDTIGYITMDYFFGVNTSGSKIASLQDREYFTLKIDGVYKGPTSDINVKLVRLSNY